MKKRLKAFSRTTIALLTAALVCSPFTKAYADDTVDSLEKQTNGLQNQLDSLNQDLTSLSAEITDLASKIEDTDASVQKAELDLAAAKLDEQLQYDAMKKRIKYMYETGNTSLLQIIFSSESMGDFLNKAEFVKNITEYDRNMLDKYISLQKNIQENEQKVETESAEIDNLMTERASKQQEVQSMASSTSDDINSYVNQISASQEEAQQLMADISNADSSITALVQQAEAEKAAEEKAKAEAAAEAERQAAEAAAQEEADQDNEDSEEADSDDDYGYDPEEDTTESSSSSTSTDIVVEEEEEADDVQSGSSEDVSEDSSQEEVSEEVSNDETASEETEDASADTSDSGSSSQGTYLGNFTLTAYCNCAQCCGTAGNLTASGTVPTAGRTVAMAGVPFGTKLLINGTVYTVEDLGTPYGHGDIYCGSHSEALSFGLQSADVYQVG